MKDNVKQDKDKRNSKMNRLDYTDGFSNKKNKPKSNNSKDSKKIK